METNMSFNSVSIALRRFREIDSVAKWTKLDDYMSYLEWIDDEQLAREADVIFEQHKLGNPRCPSSHPPEQCMVPIIIDAVDFILDGYKDYGFLDADSKYVLQYYVTLTATGDIVS